MNKLNAVLLCVALLAVACAPDTPIAPTTTTSSTTTTTTTLATTTTTTTTTVAPTTTSTTTTTTPVAIPHSHQVGAPTDAQWAALRKCESGGNYQITNSTGKYRGAYQFDRPTWDSVATPDLIGVDPAAASPSSQDATALALWTSRGWQPWPYCGVVIAANS